MSRKTEYWDGKIGELAETIDGMGQPVPTESWVSDAARRVWEAGYRKQDKDRES